MNGYMLDTNADSVLWDARHRDFTKNKSFLENISPSPVWISTVVPAGVNFTFPYFAWGRGKAPQFSRTHTDNRRFNDKSYSR